MAEHAATHTSRYKCTVFKSRLEARYAAFFDLAGWAWKYEPMTIHGWTPSFEVTIPCSHSECSDHTLLVEVKPYLHRSDFEGHPGTKFAYGQIWNENGESQGSIPYDAAACFGVNPEVSSFEMCHGAGGGIFDIPFWVYNWEALWEAADSKVEYIARDSAAVAPTPKLDPSYYITDFLRYLRQSKPGEKTTKKEYLAKLKHTAIFDQAVHFVCDPYELPATPTRDRETAINPPYPVVSIAFESKCVPVVIFCRRANLLDKTKISAKIFDAVEAVEDVLVLAVFMKTSKDVTTIPKIWWGLPYTVLIGCVKNSNAKFDVLVERLPGAGKKEKFPADAVAAFNDGANMAALTVCRLFSALGTTHTEEVIQQASPKNNRRILDGKLPIWEVKTLVLKTPVTRTVSEYQGGTHASPRQHIRRGHYRHYKSGKIAWVRDCIVGSLEKGFVHKDYRVEPAAA